MAITTYGPAADPVMAARQGLAAAGHVAAGRERAAERIAQARAALAIPDGQQLARRPAEPVQGDWLLNLTDTWIRQFCHMTDAARHTLAMWAVAQHFRVPGESRHMVWDKFGHLLLVAETPGSGKTTAMKVGGYLCAPFFFGIDNNPTAPGLCYTIAQEHAMVCVDEAHRLVGPRGTRKADVTTIMCASFEQDGSYLNGRGGKANRVRVYAPMMIAGKDVLLTSAGEEISDVIDRSVVIRMTAPPCDVDLKPVTAATREQGRLIAGKIAQWAGQEMSSGESLDAAMSAARDAAKDIGLVGRPADVWLGMFTVAALASPGHLDAACEAALELRLNRPAARDDDPIADLEASLTGGGELTSWG